MPPRFLPNLVERGSLAVRHQMFTTSYFDEYQKQFNEWQKQMSEWQKKFFDTWLETFPTGKVDVTFSDTFDKTLALQAEMVKSYLETQEKTTQMMIDTQKKFWDDYFERLRQNKPDAKVEAKAEAKAA